MGRRSLTLPLLLALSLLAVASLAWGVKKGLVDSADLERRSEEASLFARRVDPYQDPDMTYPPSAPPVFLALIEPVRGRWLRPAWIAANGIALVVFCGAILTRWGKDWPTWLKIAFVLIAAASKPTRAGMALGQFHLIPMALLAMAAVWNGLGKGVLPGMLLGLALIKPTMTGPFLIVLAFQKKWNPLGMALAVQFALMMGTSFWLDVGPITLVREWLANAKGQLVLGTIDVPTVVHMLWPESRFDASKISVLMLGISIVVVGLLRKSSTFGLLSLSCFLAAILTYHRHYDMVLLLPALAYALDRAVRTSRKTDILFAILASLLLICPSPGTSNKTLAQAYDLIFLVASYAWLIKLMASLAFEPKIAGSPGDG